MRKSIYLLTGIYYVCIDKIKDPKKVKKHVFRIKAKVSKAGAPSTASGSLQVTLSIMVKSKDGQLSRLHSLFH